MDKRRQTKRLKYIKSMELEDLGFKTLEADKVQNMHDF